jgi:integrase
MDLSGECDWMSTIPDSIFQKVSYQKIPQATPLYTSKEDFKPFLNITTDQIKGQILLAVLTGCRINEKISMTWKDIDFDRKLIQVRSEESFTTKSGKYRAFPRYLSLWFECLNSAGIQGPGYVCSHSQEGA